MLMGVGTPMEKEEAQAEATRRGPGARGREGQHGPGLAGSLAGVGTAVAQCPSPNPGGCERDLPGERGSLLGSLMGLGPWQVSLGGGGGSREDGGRAWMMGPQPGAPGPPGLGGRKDPPRSLRGRPPPPRGFSPALDGERTDSCPSKGKAAGHSSPRTLARAPGGSSPLPALPQLHPCKRWPGDGV